MGGELVSPIGAGISTAGVCIGTAVSSGSAISLGSPFPEGAAATFTSVARLDSGPIGGWGKGLAAPEPFSFGSRSAASTSFVEGPTMFNPTDQINLNSQSELNVSDVLLEAESILAQAARPQIGAVAKNPDFSIAAFSLLQPEVTKPETADVLPITKLDAAVQRNVTASLVDYGLIPDFQPQIRPNTVISKDPSVQTGTVLVARAEVKPNVGSKVLNQVANEAVTQEQETVEEVVEVLDQTESIAGENIEEEKKEETEKAQLLHIVDKKGVTRRIVHAASVILGILQARKGLDGKAKEVKVTGSEAVLGLLPSNSREIRGEEVNQKDPDEKLPDATWDETIKNLVQKEYTSENQIKQMVANAVEENHPVAVSTMGEVASDENIAATHRYVKGKNRALIEFKKRTQKKLRHVGVIIKETKKEETEGIIQDHPELSEALKAA